MRCEVSNGVARLAAPDHLRIGAKCGNSCRLSE
jgi:hypothetical protein